MHLISCLLTAGAALLFLKSRAFSMPLKIVILLSCPVLYWFPVIARVYAMIPLALCLLAGLYPVRLKRPFAYAFALIFLVHTHAFMEGLAGILGVCFLWDLWRRDRRMGGRQKKIFAGVLLLLTFGVAAAFLQVAPAFGNSSYLPPCARQLFSGSVDMLNRAGALFAGLAGAFAEQLGKTVGITLTAAVFYICLAVCMIQLFLTRGRAGLYFTARFLWQIAFAVLLFPMLMHRIFLPFLMLIFAFSLPYRKQMLRKLKPPYRKLLCSMAPLGFLALMTWPDTVYYISEDLTKPFSNQFQTAAFIEANLPENAKIVVFPDEHATGTFGALLPGRTFYRCTDGQPFKVYRTANWMPEILDAQIFDNYIGNEREVYLLFHLSAYAGYKLPMEPGRFRLGDFVIETVFCSYPPAFFSEGEDYIILRLTRFVKAE